MTERLGFQSEVEVFSRLGREVFDRESERVEVLEDEFFVCFEFFEGARRGGNRSTGFGWAKAINDGEELLGVDETGEFGPIGLVDFFLHAGSVEGPVGKSIDGKDVAVLGLEPGLEFIEVVFLK